MLQIIFVFEEIIDAVPGYPQLCGSFQTSASYNIVTDYSVVVYIREVGSVSIPEHNVSH